MVQVRRSQMSLFLILLLHFPAQTGQRRHLRVEHGETAILPCEFVIQSQYRCENTDWFFISPESRATVGLVRAGRVVVNTTDRSYRLGVREPCSLVIPMVTFNDIGHYYCRQLRSGFGRVRDSVVDLDVFIPDRVHPDLDITHSNGDGEVTTPAATKITATAASAITDAPMEQQARTDCSVVDYIMLVLRVAELVLITVITVLLIRAPGNQRPPDEDTVHQDEGMVNYENIGGPSASVRINTKVNYPQE
ncbi:uncharacterized protein LOC115574434 isoform X1 [Sparus aurata]|uniref:uncharacterized protein LOC115574434 isoform X1 n=1 Tax=Sparus aurata TaxID=8175 RepID=UPI0011C192F4|nr:uncharacterized protein LOC115574434 isoform X1 [Sparus aurata]